MQILQPFEFAEAVAWTLGTAVWLWATVRRANRLVLGVPPALWTAFFAWTAATHASSAFDDPHHRSLRSLVIDIIFLGAFLSVCGRYYLQQRKSGATGGKAAPPAA